MTDICVIGSSHDLEPFTTFMAKAGLGYNSLTPRTVQRSDLEWFHKPEYLSAVLDGWCDEWAGRDHKQTDLAMSAVGASLRAAVTCWRGEQRRLFVPFGMQTLPTDDTPAYGQVFNDAALVAGWLMRRGLKVTLLDLGRPHEQLHPRNPYYQEFQLHADAYTDVGFVDEVTSWVPEVREHAPDVILYSADARLMAQDDTNESEATVFGYQEAAGVVASLADEVSAGYVIAGGPPGRHPEDWTPASWVATCRGLAIPELAAGLNSPAPDTAALPDVIMTKRGFTLLKGGAA